MSITVATRGVNRVAGSGMSTNWAKVGLAFALPLSSLISIRLVGNIYGQDLLGIVILIVLGTRSDAVRKLGQVRIFFILLTIWLAGQILTDFVRATPIEDYSRGWSKIIMFGVQFAALWLFLTRSLNLFLAYMLGTGLAQILNIFQLEPAYAANPWKFGLGSGLVFIVAVLAVPLSKRLGGRLWVPTGMLLFAGALALYHGARSQFGITLLSAGYVYIAAFLSSHPARARQVTPGRFVLIIISGFIFAQGLVSTYQLAASNGIMGEDARQKYITQTSGDLNVLQGGRVESLVSTVAIADSPIIGHGSWAQDIYYVRLLRTKLTELGMSAPPESQAENDLIPTHSHFLGAWVEAGVFGALFWGWAFAVCVIALYSLLKLPRVPHAVVAVAAISMLWDIPFSPFGADVRFIRSAEIALLLYIIRESRFYQRKQRLFYSAHKNRSSAYSFEGRNRPAQMLPKPEPST